MGFENQHWNYFDEGSFDQPLASIRCNGITVTAVAAPSEAIHSKTEPYDFIELPDGLEAIVVISEDYIQELIKKPESVFSKGFALGMFVNYILREKMAEMLEYEYDNE